MNYKFVFNSLAASFVNGICLSQTNQSAVVEDSQTTPSTQHGKQYPQVNSEGRVRASILAQVKSPARYRRMKYDLTKDEKGVWTGESRPQDQGFHYYQLNIDGASVPDPEACTSTVQAVGERY